MAVILFDIDGTLVDTTGPMTQAIHEALEQLPHLPKPSEDAVRSGYGLAGNAFWEHVIPEATIEEIRQIRKLRHETLERAMEGQHVLFDGIYEMLEALHKKGHTLTTASNCGVHYLNLILDSQNIRQFMTAPECLESVSGEKKADILTAHRLRHGENDYVMVGDRKSDVEAARAHDFPVVLTGFGFGNEDEWALADHVIATPNDLITYIES
ncbi:MULTISPECIES: HAD family hydrolase [Exiguobacterium]|uniref:HAD family hydrolase n=1 Tax=Exiguobacterium TaxID=33986 RepID=UPI0004950F93|nr:MULTISPECIES: HAD family hydrolase [Exiguobacterium]TCI71511.1 HAD family hydrolase [Exiguobacterium sp. IPCI3]TCI81491.1 HAD family hydrolase [Exiguobacterium sp. IPCH1]TCI82688.1 HAD family hydrolase [Exiguobacterium sp. IPBC4]